MRKNKKLLLGGLSVLTLVAAGSGAVSTFAWYSATASAQRVNNTTASGIVVASSSVEAAANIWLKLIPTVTQQCGFTDPSGAAYATVGGVLYAATNTNGYGIVTLEAKAYSNAGCTSEITSGDAKLAGVTGNYKFDAVASNRARITLTDPSTPDTSVYTNAMNNTLDKAVTVNINGSGEISITAGATIYFSVSGNAQNKTVYASKAAFDTARGETSESDFLAAGNQYVGMTVDPDTTLTPSIALNAD